MKKFMKKLAKKTEGFTLVELIVVIAILGILAGIAVPAYSGYLTKANEAASIVECDAVKTAAMAALATKGEVSKIVIDDGKVTATYGESNATTELTKSGEVGASDFDMYYTSTVSTKFHNDYTKATWDPDTSDEWQFAG